MEIDKLNAKQFAAVFSKVIERIKEDPIENFVKAGGFMDLEPTPVQEVILKVIFQKTLDPDAKRIVQIEAQDLDGRFALITASMTEVEIYEFLTDKPYDPKAIEEVKVNKIDLICGRRSGKTLISAIVAIYCAISNNWKPFLKKTPFATVLIMSHSREFSDEVLEVIKSLIEASPILSKLINNQAKQTTSAMNLKVPWVIEGGVIEYSKVQIKVGAASSKTTRGMAACAVLCDEIAYWNLDETMKETDVKIMKAVRPATKQFGDLAMLIKLSSPGIKQGVLYNEYKADRDGKLPKSYAVFKAPTWMMNSLIPNKEIIEEWELDQDGFDTEYRSNFADSLSNFMSPEMVEIARMRTVKFLAPLDTKEAKYFAAIDAAFKADRFTFTIVSVRENRVTQHVTMGWEGSRKEPVKAHTVAQYIKNITKSFPVDFVAADQFAFQPLKEIFDQYNVELREYTFAPMFKKKIYFNLKKLINSQQMDLLDHEQQAKELKELVVEQSATGTIKIGHPAGGKDDFADSLAVASFLATEGQTTGKFEFESALPVKSYGVKTDVDGKAFTAPSPEMLVASGHLAENVMDNSELYGIDPMDGRLKRKDQFEDAEEEEDDGPNFDFG
jgi:hypothetical protein